MTNNRKFQAGDRVKFNGHGRVSITGLSEGQELTVVKSELSNGYVPCRSDDNTLYLVRFYLLDLVKEVEIIREIIVSEWTNDTVIIQLKETNQNPITIDAIRYNNVLIPTKEYALELAESRAESYRAILIEMF